jgi:hypothetical protein
MMTVTAPVKREPEGTSMAGFYVRRGEKTFGPYSTDQLKEGTQKGQIRSGDSIAPSKEGPWTPVEQVKGLALKSDTTTPPLQAAPVTTAPARRDGNTVVLPLNTTMPMKCIVSGCDVEHLREKRLIYYRGLPQIIYFLMALGIFPAAAGIATSDMNVDTKGRVDNRIIDAMADARALTGLFGVIGIIGLIISGHRTKKVDVEVGIAADFQKRQSNVVAVSALLFIAGGGVTAGSIQRFDGEVIFGGCVCGLLLFLVFYKLFLERPRLKIVHMSEKCIVIKGADESFLRHLEELSDTERKVWLAKS